MLKITQYSSDIFSQMYLKAMLPEDHILLRIKKFVDFSFVVRETADLYSDIGRGSIDPERMFKLLFLMYFENIPSERELVEQVRVNVLYRYFADINLDESVPDHSSFTVFRERLGKDRFKKIFQCIVEQCIRHNLVDGKHISFDNTLFKANAALPKKKEPNQIKKDLEKLIERTFNEESENFSQKKNPIVSKTDPDAGLVTRPNKGTMFAYSMHIGCDSKEKIITSVAVTPGTTKGEAVIIDQVKEQKEKYNLPIEKVSADSEYNDGEVRNELEKMKITPYIPIRKSFPKKRPGMFSHEQFIYNKKKDRVICPNKKVMSYRGLTSDGKARIYRAKNKDCLFCPVKQKCTKAKIHPRSIQISIYEESMARAKVLNKSPGYKEAQRIRKTTTEPKFSEAKRYHGLNRARYRGLAKVTIQAFLIAICINVKRMVTLLFSQLAMGFT